MNKRKIINDPVYGFISIPSDFLFDLIEHPWFQRLRRIRQLGLTELVYPGALHTRFHHAIGAMYLMDQALQTLKGKGHAISEEEATAAQAAILLHDLGHGPFSHVLENTLLPHIPHEQISLLLMKELNVQFHGRLDLAIEMFEGVYKRKFFHQLISSQLDMDRLDYLNRDCYYTGVIEGSIGTDRIIKMLDIVDDQLVVEEKGLLSIEHFLNARRTMYWQVYLHKTSLCAETMLSQIVGRARELAGQGTDVFATPVLSAFLRSRFQEPKALFEPGFSALFTNLDDTDLWASIKVWMLHDDFVLSTLCRMLLSRSLFKLQFVTPEQSGETFEKARISLSANGVPAEYLHYFAVEGKISNAAYLTESEQIKVKMKNGGVIDISEASELPAIRALSKIVSKHFVSWAKNVSLRPKS
ncbi:HD domain-containing protein [Ravibacter arvi]|uniref:HD domain-containing protein n=1 Tax=Ravibacter arvi TaxID=2051041 RepID=A0ABP8LYT2_9BACT